MTDAIDVYFPESRMVQGSVYEMNDKDWQGKPLTYKTGEKTGQTYKKSHVAVAIPKTPGVGHWASESWGAPIWAAGHAAFPKGEAQAATFAWKVEDGDSTTPNKKGTRNCDREGFAGCWIVHAGQPERLPKALFPDGNELPASLGHAIKCGYRVRLVGRVSGNGQTGGNAGIYINAEGVVLIDKDKEITSGPNAGGIVQAAGPAAASEYVRAMMASAATVAPPRVSLPNVPGSPPPPPGTVGAVYAAPPAAPVPAAVSVVPSPTFLAPPPPAAVPAAPGVSVAVMTAKAGSLTYAQFIAQGWNDGTLRANGYMV